MRRPDKAALRQAADTARSGEPYLPFVDMLKCLCLFGVILGHLCTWQIQEVQPGTAAWNLSNVYNSLCRVCVPVFLMVTGWLVLGRQDCRRAEAASWQKAGHFLLCYLFWAAFYTAINPGKSLLCPQTWLDGVIQGEFHLWYLLMMAGIYAVLPLLVRITRRREDVDRALLAAFVSTILLPSLSGLPGWERLQEFTSRFYLDTGYLFYLLLGCRLRRWPLKRAARRLILLGGAAGTLWSAAATWYLSVQNGTFSDFWLDQRRINVSLGAAALFLLVQGAARKAPPWLFRSLAKHSLGVYAVHVLFLLALRKWNVSVYAFPAVWWLPLLAAAVLCAGWACAAGLARLPLLRRFV